jgi:Zn-dependent protease with chaperone function
MFSKPLNFALVYIVTIINIVILLSPFLALSLPFIDLRGSVLIVDYSFFSKAKFVFFGICFAVSFLMLCYMVLDFFFGFSTSASLKNCTRFEKNKDYDFLNLPFNQVKEKFAQKNVKLYIKNSEEINAYAVASLGKKAIILTDGLINHYLVNSSDPKMFIYSIRSVISHEMSHLINKDFLPTFLIIINQKVTNFISTILHYAFYFLIKIMRTLRFTGDATTRFISDIYTLVNFILTSFNRFVVYNLYEFLRRFISRAVEYRCDAQAGKAFGGRNMALALSMMGEGGYFTLFSTHPSTSRRINKVQNIKIQDRIVSARFIDILSNYFSLMLLIIICLYFAKQAKIDLMVRYYIKHQHQINGKVSTFWQLINKFF